MRSLQDLLFAQRVGEIMQERARTVLGWDAIQCQKMYVLGSIHNIGLQFGADTGDVSSALLLGGMGLRDYKSLIINYSQKQAKDYRGYHSTIKDLLLESISLARQEEEERSNGGEGSSLSAPRTD